MFSLELSLTLGSAVLAPTAIPPTLLFNKGSGLAASSAYTVASVPLDLSANRYILRFEGATWGSNNYEHVRWRDSGGANGFYMRREPANGGSMVMYIGCTGYAFACVGTGISRGPSDMWVATAGTPYQVDFEMGWGQIMLVVDDAPKTKKAGSAFNCIGLYKRLTTNVEAVAVAPGRIDMTNMDRVDTSANTSFTGMKIFRREIGTIRNLVMLGDSITDAQDFDLRMRTNLGRSWFIANHAVGYRKTPNFEAGVLNPIASGETGFANGWAYADVTGHYRSGAHSNVILAKIGTNDLLNYVADGVTSADIITSILDAIANIRTDNAGWRIVFRPVFLCGLPTVVGANFATYRDAINASIRSGSIFAAVDGVIDDENIFFASADRTDGETSNGSCYNASFYPNYTQNTTYFSAADGVHPTTAGYQAIADYVAPRL